jgi:methionine-gamma-lyase
MASRTKRAPKRARPRAPKGAGSRAYGGSSTRIEERYHPDTVQVHGRFHTEHWNYSDHIVPPQSASAAYRLESVKRGAAGFQEFANPDLDRAKHAPIYIYERLDEPTRGQLEENLALLEGGERCLCFASGMAAISAALGVLLHTGDRVLAHPTLYGCTYSLFANWYPRYGITVQFVDVTDPVALATALGQDDVMAVYFETPCNPTMELVDLRAVSRAVARANAARARRRHGVKHRRIFSVVDNTFATPFGQRPLEHGIDMVVHSLTKNLGGFGTDMGGAVVFPRLLESDLLLYRKDFGGPLAPRSAWPALVYGLPSLGLRTRRQQEIAMQVARFLERHPKVSYVRYPGLSSHPQYALARRQMRSRDGRFAPGILLSFVLKGSPEQARRRGARMMDHLAKHSLAITLAVSLGQVRTLIEHPASMTHAAVPAKEQVLAGIEPGGVRMSLGIEDPVDIIHDLKEALARV